MTPEPTDHEHEYELVMPFVLCESQGGPHDDSAFVSGWRLGHLDAVLSAVRGTGTSVIVMEMIEEREREQADLLAMRHGSTMTTEPLQDGWLEATFEFAIINEEPPDA